MLRKDGKILNQQQERIASDIFLAFEYQWDFFVLEVLKLLEKDTVVSFEYLDDVAKQSGNKVILFQVKHSIRRKTNGRTINLTNRDCDLWKTISIWIKFIEENKDSDREAYIENNTFILVTNKSSEQNVFLDALLEYETNGDISGFKEKISFIEKSGIPTSDVSCQIRKFLNLPYLEKFIKHIRVNFLSNELESEIKDLMEMRFVLKKNKVENVYERLMTKMRDNAKEIIRNSGVVQYTYDTIKEQYWSIIQEGRDKLIFRTDYPSYNGNPYELMFIKQLIAVNDISKGDYDDIVNYTNEWFQFHNNIKDKWNNHDISESDIQNLTNDVFTNWRNNYKQNYRRLSENSSVEDLNDAANKVLISVRNAPLSIANVPMGAALSNGCFYYYSNNDSTIVSDMPQIGWHINWKEIFKKNE